MTVLFYIFLLDIALDEMCMRVRRTVSLLATSYHA